MSWLEVKILSLFTTIMSALTLEHTKELLWKFSEALRELRECNGPCVVTSVYTTQEGSTSQYAPVKGHHFRPPSATYGGGGLATQGASLPWYHKNLTSPIQANHMSSLLHHRQHAHVCSCT